MALLAKQRTRAEFERKEVEFLFDQTKIRSEIRLRESRARPIDVLIKHLTAADDDVPSYSVVFKGLTLNELDQLQDEIRLLLDFDRANAEYWDALLEVCSWELTEARNRKQDDDAARVCREDSFAEEKKLLQGKTRAELEALQSHIESDMRAGKAILKQLPVFKAKACLKDIHAQLLLERRRSLDPPSSMEESMEDGVLPKAKDDVRVLSSSAKEEEDRAMLKLKPMATVLQEEDNFEMKTLKIMGSVKDGDAIFGSGAEVNLDSQLHVWHHDEYKPRKPKYFNRVQTRYLWNQYDRIHYDHDNPPLRLS
ncbi:hypothetical protein RIF29_25691 [Crotalaria pallida]|uniref:Splicing factor Cactin n=1 Tax=Crotalaria pallida TaxID=3830 RepID=A0AAN9EMJ2_CROPI